MKASETTNGDGCDYRGRKWTYLSLKGDDEPNSHVLFDAENMKNETEDVSASEEISMNEAQPAIPSTVVLSQKPKLVEAHGFMVLEIHAPLVERIYAKYGDISAECDFSTPYVKTALMESLIRIVTLFEQNTAQSLGAEDVALIQDSLRDLELAKFDIRWLKERYNAALIPNELAEDAKTYERLCRMISKTEDVLGKLKADLQEVSTRMNKKRRTLVKTGWGDKVLGLGLL